MYCAEAKGHFSFHDLYSDMMNVLEYDPDLEQGINIVSLYIYVNMCDTAGEPCLDALDTV